jgi:dTDP-4-amino-4,6-dideoxygalactose transaminase
VLDTPILSMGQEIPAFEAAFQELTGRRHAIAVNSGTAGLHLCVRAAGIGINDGQAGDLVITTPFSFVASTNVLLYEQATPVYVDVDPVTGNIDPALVIQAIQDLVAGGGAARRWLPRWGWKEGAQLKAILPVDVFGQPAEMDPILATARQYGLKVIEDSCEALGATYKNRPAGTLGDMGVFAFYPNKQITTGEGGLIVTDDTQAAAYMRALRNQGRAPGDTWLDHTHLGYNYRLDEMSAALGRTQIRRLEQFLAQRQQVVDWYNARLGELPEIELPAVVSRTTRMSWFVYVIRFRPGINRDRVARRLHELGIPARPYFVPIHIQPYMVERFGYQAEDYPVTADLGRRSLAIPFSSVMSEAQVDKVFQAIRFILNENNFSSPQ